MRDKYKNKSIAEQNSLDLAWDLLMESRFLDLRDCMFATKDELARFRQVSLSQSAFIAIPAVSIVFSTLPVVNVGSGQYGVGH